MRAADLAVVLELALMPDGAEARPIDRADAGDVIREARIHRHRGMREHGRHLAAVRPGLIGKVDIEAERLGDLIVVDAERRADVDQKPVDVAALRCRRRQARS